MLTTELAGFGSAYHPQFLELPRTIAHATGVRCGPRVLDEWRLGKLFYDDAREVKEAWLVLRDGIPVGRIAALLNETASGVDTTLGFFECINDASVAASLFSAALSWAAERGATNTNGPRSFGEWTPEGVQVQGTHTRPFGFTPHNPEYYAQLWEEYGFKVSAQFQSWDLIPGGQNPTRDASERLQVLAAMSSQLANRSDVRVRPVPKAFVTYRPLLEFARRAEVGRSRDQRSETEVHAWLIWLQLFSRPDMILAAETDDGIVGLLYAAPDLLYGLPFDASWRRAQSHMRKNFGRSDAVRVQGIVTLSDYANTSVAMELLTAFLIRASRRRKLSYVEASPIPSDDKVVNSMLTQLGCSVNKVWNLYDAPAVR